MKFQITLENPETVEANDGEQLTAYAAAILTQMLAESVERQLSISFAPENAQRVSEEIGFRRGLQVFASHFSGN